MRVLFTNNTLDRPAGTERSLFDYATSLVKSGHEAAAFSRQLGEIGEALKAAGVRVCDDFAALPWAPDVIHGHHQWETTLAALRFPETPVISFCRGTLPWQEAPCLAPNVVRYVGVDEPCCERLKSEWNLPADRVVLLPNGVDLERFPERSAPLPARLGRVLVFSNYAREDNFFGDIRRACESLGIACEGIGAGLKNAVSDPAPVLASADLVFAKGKAALEALVSGCGVVVCDENGIGPLVTPDTFGFVRAQSFAYEAMTGPVTEEAVRDRLGQWNAETAAETARLARREASLEATMDRLREIYEAAIAHWTGADRPDSAAFLRHAADFFSQATLPYKLGKEAREIWRISHGGDDAPSETIEMNRILHALRESENRIGRLSEKLEDRDRKIAGLKEKLESLRAEGGSRKKRRWFG